ncbi:MAG: hypothetical protein WBG29_17955, partial [Candidatus Acidiferrales bacterium]
MNIAKRFFLNMKSGLPGRFMCLRHPGILEARNKVTKRVSVVLFPLERILAMLRERCSRVSQSVMA